MKRLFLYIACLMVSMGLAAQSKRAAGSASAPKAVAPKAAAAKAAMATPQWTGTWATAVEFTGKGDMPRTTTLANTSLRQVIQVSLGGDRLTLQLSNEFSREPVEIASVYVADALDSCDIDRRTAQFLRFGGRRNVTIQPGQTVNSDAFAYALKPLQRLAITINYGAAVPANPTSHRGSRTTSYIAKGATRPKDAFRTFEKVDHWYNLAKLNVLTTAKAVAVLGNSITDGRGTTTNGQNRWPDMMAAALQGAQPTGVLNLGIGGNCVVSGGLSEPALKRFDRDILGQSGADRLIIFQGTNDIGTSHGNSEQVAQQLIEAYQQLIAKGRAKGMRVYGGTITPFKGNGWYSLFHEAARQVVNEWIRTSGAFDGVIDFDQLVRDPAQPDRLRADYSEDWLHLNPAGYKAMGEYAAGILNDEKMK